MATRTVYRKADISSAEAIASLTNGFPGSQLLSFDTKTASAVEAKAAGAKEGDLVFEATVKLAEFPPSDDSSSDDSGDSAPAPPKDDGGDDKSEKSDDSGSEDKGGDAPDFGGGGDDGGDGGEEPKLKGDDGIIHLLTEILHAVKGDGGLGAPGGLGDDPGLGGPPGLPDVGAPGQGEGLPPDAGLGGPPGGAPGGAPPLPPPVKEKSPIGGAAFAHYDPRQATINVVRHEADNRLKTKAILDEAHELYPTHKVAQIKRNGSAQINGSTVDLRGNNVAVVTLIKK